MKHESEPDSRPRPECSSATETQSVDVLNKEWITFLHGKSVAFSCEKNALGAKDSDSEGGGSDNQRRSSVNASDATVEYHRMEEEHIAVSSSMCHPTQLYISTKTIIVYMHTKLDLNELFWNCPIIDYSRTQEGVIKKQMKITLTTQGEIDAINAKLANYKYHSTKVIAHINKCNESVHDVRKINIGISKKDLSASSKYMQKGAFYNCFVITLRIYLYDRFHEVHIKAFNSGNIEIPGIKDSDLLNKAVEQFCAILRTLGVIFLNTTPFQRETILINSNFYCGYNINREVLYRLLIDKYKITCWYDSCSYPGIQCKYYCYDETTLQDIRDDVNIAKHQLGQKHILHPKCKNMANSLKIYEVSFFIFRTGNVLIVGRCTESVLFKIYNFIKTVLQDEHDNVKTISSHQSLANRTHQPKHTRYNRLSILVTR